MGLTKYRMGQLVEPISVKCGISNCDWVSGVNIFKRFMPSRNVGADTSNYLVVPTGAFAFNLMHVGRDGKIPVAMNDTDTDVVVSSAYFVFRVINEDIMLKEYLYILMTSPEFDRYAAYCTDASVRDGLDWSRFCEFDVNLPPIPIQQKYVDVYNAMLANQRSYESGLEDLKLTCDAFIEQLRKTTPLQRIEPYIHRVDIRNSDNKIKNVMGVSVTKEFREPTAKVNRKELSNYKVVKPREISFVQTTHNEKVFAYAFNNTPNEIVVSSVNEVFYTDEKILLPEFLCLFFNRTEFDRYARFHSWGSARETFTWSNVIEVRIPIPDIEVQRSIVGIYNAYIMRREINERLKAQIKDLCPILIKGALEEAGV